MLQREPATEGYRFRHGIVSAARDVECVCKRRTVHNSREFPARIPRRMWSKGMHLGCSSLGQLARLREGVARQRISSWDRTGGNRDFFTLAPGQNLKGAEIKGAGCIRHIWMTLS